MTQECSLEAHAEPVQAVDYLCDQIQVMDNYNPPSRRPSGIRKKLYWKFTLKYPSGRISTHTDWAYEGEEPSLMAFVKKYGGPEVIGQETRDRSF